MDTFGLSKGAFHDRDTIAHGKNLRTSGSLIKSIFSSPFAQVSLCNRF